MPMSAKLFMFLALVAVQPHIFRLFNTSRVKLLFGVFSVLWFCVFPKICAALVNSFCFSVFGVVPWFRLRWSLGSFCAALWWSLGSFLGTWGGGLDLPAPPSSKARPRFPSRVGFQGCLTLVFGPLLCCRAVAFWWSLGRFGTSLATRSWSAFVLRAMFMFLFGIVRRRLSSPCFDTAQGHAQTHACAGVRTRARACEHVHVSTRTQTSARKGCGLNLLLVCGKDFSATVAHTSKTITHDLTKIRPGAQLIIEK